MKDKTLLFIYNPWAGKRELLTKLHDVLDCFIKGGFRVTTRPTQSDNDAYRVTKDQGQHYDYVVCSGGDGTLNEVIHGLMEMQGEKPFLGYLPAGSTNDFATSLGLPKDIIKAAKVVCQGLPCKIDIGQLENRYFSYVAAFGLFTDVTYDTSQSMKNLFGHTAYLLEGVKRLGAITPFPCRIICGEEEFQDDYLLGILTNSASVGGFQLPGEMGNANNREFYLILLRYMPRVFDYAGTIGTLLGNLEPGPQFTIRKASEVKIVSPNPVPWTLDGEYGGQYAVNHLQIHKDALEIMVPQNLLKD